MGLHVHLDLVFHENALKCGVQRKNKFIINTGDNLTALEREARIKENKRKFGLSNDEIKSLRLPKETKSGKKRGETVLTLD